MVAATNTRLFATEGKADLLRVIAYNIYGLSGWPRQKKLAQKAVSESQMAKRLAMELALHEPDIINFSESPNEALTKQVAELLGMNHVRFPSGGNWPGTLLSKFEIAESQNAPTNGDHPKELFTRHWGRAIINLPNASPLIVHVAHLHPAADPTNRLKEIRAMIESMKLDFDSGSSMILMGDLNHGPETEEYQLWVDAGWVDTFAEKGKGVGATFRSDAPEWRIDYVMAAGPIAERIVESRALFEGAFRLNIADDKSFALSDHLPQLAVFAPGKPSEL
ncbi:endonuclease/exonuclease/phosphatase family protein [Planctomycetaceae bacterium SH139]